MEKQNIIIQTPVLLIGFNRPDTMQQVFNAVRQVKPQKLYFAVDGPRNNRDENELIGRVRSIVNQVDWPCDVHTLFHQTNLGCGRGPAEAISWAFKDEERMIVLEDDCLPSISFFLFCDEMLEKYSEDKRVNIISGRSHWHGSRFFDKSDYIFTRFAHTLGWATWKRVWNEFDMYMKDFPQWLETGGSKNLSFNKKIGERIDKDLLQIYQNIDKEVTHSWDSQFFYTRLKTGGLGIVPSANLVRNIGFGGTHDFIVDKLQAEEMPTSIRHPLFVVPNREYDLYHYNNHISKNHIGLVQRFNRKLCKFVKLFLRHP